jgi:hypothetical protein
MVYVLLPYFRNTSFAEVLIVIKFAHGWQVATKNRHYGKINRLYIINT